MVLKKSYLSDSSITSVILDVANERHVARSNKAFKKYLSQVISGASNVILDSLPSIDGITKATFLSRMTTIPPFIAVKRERISEKIETLINLISDYSEDAPSSHYISAKVTVKVEAMRTLCEMATSPEMYPQMSEWLQKNSSKLNHALVYCLSMEHQELAQETCYAIAYLSRKFHFAMLDGMDTTVSALVRIIAIAMVPREMQVDTYREARDKHTDLELVRAKTLPFHFQRMCYAFEEVSHRLVSCAYYALADVLNSVPCPRLIHFFECRIFRRKEMTRILLFRILHAVAINIPELHTDSELYNVREVDSNDKAAVAAEELRRLKYSELWENLPALLYTEILRVYDDNNRVNKNLILDCMAMFRAHAPVKLPIFEDDAIRALEVYNAREGGLKAVRDGNHDIWGAKRLSISMRPSLRQVGLENYTQDTETKSAQLAENQSDYEFEQDDKEVKGFGSYDSDENNVPGTMRPSEIPVHLPEILNFVHPNEQ